MVNPEYLIYAAHLAFWAAFGIARLVARSGLDDARAPTATAAPVAATETTARFSRALLFFHMLAFAVMYFGIANAVIPGRVPTWFPGQRIAGTTLLALGAALACWALLHFRSWRLRARLDEGHELATGGPFRLMRHPIYMGLNLLALGSAIWIPTPLLWIAVVLMVVGSDLRGRAEEKLLAGTFGATYADYCLRTRRFIPGLY